MTDSETQAMEIAYEEVRSVVDHQLDIAARTDRELLRLLYINLVVLGALFPIIQFQLPLNVIQAITVLPWFLLSTLTLLSAVFFSIRGYRWSLYYGGYEDSPFMNFQEITGIKSDSIRTKGFDENPEFPGKRSFLFRLLLDYSNGIRHNNFESFYKSTLVRNVEELMFIGIFHLLVGSFLSISPIDRISSDLTLVNFLFLISGLISIYYVWKAIQGYRSLESRQSDDNRISGEDFDLI